MILCGDVPHAQLPVNDPGLLCLTTSRPGRNVRLRLTDLTQAMWGNVPHRVLDLLDLATYVYAADQAVARGEDREADFGDGWRRHLFLRVAVREPDFWNSPRVACLLVNLLSFLSDDVYHFEFTAPKRHQPEQPDIDFSADPFEGRIEEVALFSGGLDSLAGAVHQAVTQRRQMMLVHHRSNPKLASRHRHLLAGLLGAQGVVPPVHIPVRINKSKGLTREGTQRTRSFLFMTIAAALANSIGHDRIRFYENGVTSLNLPPAAQVVGGRATRTTHPRVLNGYKALLGEVLGRPFDVENPFRWQTKAQVVRVLADAACGPLIRYSTSCANVRRTSTERPHCGVCSQCIDRRFAILAAGLAEHDPSTGYEVDLLVGPRAEGHEKTMLAIYVELANQIQRMGTWDFFRRFGEATRVLRHTGDPPEAAAANVFNLYKAHALAVAGVIDQAVSRYASHIRQRSLPPDCLLRMVTDSGPIAVASVPDSRGILRNSFRRRGAAWLVRFEGGEDFVLLSSRGASYLYELITHPNVAMSAAQLMYAVTRNPALRTLDAGEERVDREARMGLRVRFTELEEGIREAQSAGDEGREEQLSEERTKLMAELRRVFGPGGRPRRLDGEAGRVRKAVGNAITRAIDEIRKYEPYLAAHLDSPYLQRGRNLQYSPPDGLTWEG